MVFSLYRKDKETTPSNQPNCSVPNYPIDTKWVYGHNEPMRHAKKLKNLEVDGRGRITLPKDLRKGIEGFAIEPQKDGTLKLIPQKQVSLEDAKLIERLKKSIENAKKGNVTKVPPEWME